MYCGLIKPSLFPHNANAKLANKMCQQTLTYTYTKWPRLGLHTCTYMQSSQRLTHIQTDTYTHAWKIYAHTHPSYIHRFGEPSWSSVHRETYTKTHTWVPREANYNQWREYSSSFLSLGNHQIVIRYARVPLTILNLSLQWVQTEWAVLKPIHSFHSLV